MNSSDINIISIDGNIGAGKSTILNKLRKAYSSNLSVIFLEEPVDIWMNVKSDDGVSLLNHFYADQKKYAFMFQVLAYSSRLSRLRKCIRQIEKRRAITGNNHPICIITERCMLSDKFIFAQMMKDTDKMTSIEFAVYNQMFDNFSEEIPPISVIHINTSPETCLERCIKRSRNGEDNITLEYLTMCDQYTNEFLNKIKNDGDARSLILDCNISTDTCAHIINNNVETAKTFINSHITP
jgi:deoxyguanosine kinase